MDVSYAEVGRVNDDVIGASTPVHGCGVSIPWMLMTGTQDVSAIGDVDVESRLAVFPALPPGGKYELVLHGAEHSAFSDRAVPGDKEQRNPNHHRAILALSAAFWDAWLRHEPVGTNVARWRWAASRAREERPLAEEVTARCTQARTDLERRSA
jgi:hypothetical protein